jgi:hypothetical protein
LPGYPPDSENGLVQGCFQDPALFVEQLDFASDDVVSHVEEALCAVSALDDKGFSDCSVVKVVRCGFDLLRTDERRQVL